MGVIILIMTMGTITKFTNDSPSTYFNAVVGCDEDCGGQGSEDGTDGGSRRRNWRSGGLRARLRPLRWWGAQLWPGSKGASDGSRRAREDTVISINIGELHTTATIHLPPLSPLLSATASYYSRRHPHRRRHTQFPNLRLSPNLRQPKKKTTPSISPTTTHHCPRFHPPPVSPLPSISRSSFSLKCHALRRLLSLLSLSRVEIRLLLPHPLSQLWKGIIVQKNSVCPSRDSDTLIFGRSVVG
ncbi:uncharacterized protein LOC132269876 [Cornus florida]|uniref:uncharacterized protein LOC132269876 n=1 Tax=Cornus florida TaxID=4283 RepID=UPI0028A24AF9|nr:uncharacterized protein LOC132269876 [Cornus florida]